MTNIKDKLEVVYADITKETTDAVVNAANDGLWAGSGVCGAIHSAGGPVIEEECMAISQVAIDDDGTILGTVGVDYFPDEEKEEDELDFQSDFESEDEEVLTTNFDFLDEDDDEDEEDEEDELDFQMDWPSDDDNGVKMVRCPTGEVRTTSAGNMPAEFVIHAVGPVWQGGDNDEDELLYKVHYNIIKEADKLKIKTVSLPAISTGIFGYPLDRASGNAVKGIVDGLKEFPSVELVRWCVLDDKTHDVYTQTVQETE